MYATSFLRGHKIEYVNNEWRYIDNKESIENNERPCSKCGNKTTKEGHDSCLSELPGVKNACCGHGKENGYIMFENDTTIRFELKSIETK